MNQEVGGMVTVNLITNSFYGNSEQWFNIYVKNSVIYYYIKLAKENDFPISRKMLQYIDLSTNRTVYYNTLVNSNELFQIAALPIF